MPFDESVITSGPTCSQTAQHELLVAWTSSAPPGTTFQVYLDRKLSWSGTDSRAYFAVPPSRTKVWVGAVAAGEQDTDFGPSLADPLGGGDRADLDWHAGRYLDATLASFNIYRGATPGASPSYATPVGSILASYAGLWADGFGEGRFGRGGFGHAEVAYNWQSKALTSGAWHFAVTAVDGAGNEGPPSTTTVTIAAPPSAPAPLGTGKGRLAYTFNPSTRVATLTWGASH